MEEYPQLTKDQEMLRFLHRRMEEAWNRGETQTTLAYYTGEVTGEERPPGLYIYEGNVDIGEKIGVRGAEAVSMFKRLDHAGYVISDIEHFANSGITTFRGLTNDGLAQIGKLPDPKEQLRLGLEAALREIDRDPNLSPEEKEQKINAGREAIAFIRALTAEVAAKVLVGG